MVLSGGDANISPPDIKRFNFGEQLIIFGIFLV